MKIKNTSPSYRIIMGTLSLLTAIVMGIFSGFAYYNPDSSVIWALISLGSALIGLGLVKTFKPQKNDQVDHDHNQPDQPKQPH
jgi:hypothetical protein